MVRSWRWVSVVTAVTMCLGLVAVPAGQASAWSNGVDGYNSYGTHDWILDHALRALGHRAGWVCERAALRATDDPDSRDGLDHASATWWHVWDEWGAPYGGAPEAVEVWFDRARDRLDHGRECAASKALGIMAHLLADVANPLHTDGSTAEDRIHSSYDSAVDTRSEIGDHVYGFRFDGVDRASPYGRTLKVARQAHRSYRDLVRAYDRHGYDRIVHRITKRQLDRAADAVADVIVAIG